MTYTMRDIRRHDGEVISIAGTLVILPEHEVSWAQVLIVEQDITSQVAAERERQKVSKRYQELFEQTPLSVWEEDWSAVKLRIDELTSDGIVDLASYLRTNMDVADHLVDIMRVTAVNPAAIAVYGIDDVAGLLSGDVRVPTGDEEVDALVDWIAAFASGTFLANRVIEDKTLDGRNITTYNSVVVPEGHQHDWSRVVIQGDDVTLRHDAQRQIEESERRCRELFEHSPIAIREYDWSAIRRRVDVLLEQGVDDLEQHLKNDPELVRELRDLAVTSDMNNAAMRLYGAASCSELEKGARDIPPTRDELEVLIATVAALLREDSFVREMVQETYDYRMIVVRATATISERSAESRDRVVILLEDITEEREIRSRAEAGERRYRELFEQTPVGIRVDDWSHIKRQVERLFVESGGRLADYLITNRDVLRSLTGAMRVMDVNDYGIEQRERFAERCMKTLSDDLLNELARVLEQLAQDEQIIRRGETAENLADGTAIFTRGTVMVPAEFRQDWVRVILTIEDVTEVFQTRSAMESSERRYRELFEQSPVAIWVEDWSAVKAMVEAMDVAGSDASDYIEAHPQFVDDAYLAMKLVDFNEMAWRQRHAEGRKEFQAWSEQPLPAGERLSSKLILQALARGERHIVLPDLQQTRLDDTEYFERGIAFVPPEFNDSWSRIIHVMEDVSAEHLALQSLSQSRYMMEQAQRMTDHGHYVYDTLAQEFSEVSDSLLRIFYVAREGFSFAGDQTMRIVYEDDRERVREVLQGSLERLEAADLEYRTVLPDGGVRRVHEVTEFLPPTGTQRSNRCIGSVQDVTEAWLVENAMREARDEAERASNAKTEFLATISHELRTPLNAIIGFSDVILEGMFGSLDNPRYDEYVRDINESGRHLLELINDILDLAKAEAGRLDLHEEEVDLNLVVGLSAKLFCERAERSGMQLDVVVPDGMPRIRADSRKLRQLLLNLLSNAVKFTPDHGRVTVETLLREDGGIDLLVADTGIGMTRQDMERAFEAFGQVDSALTRRYEGTGLGLPLARAVARLHDGELLMQSQPGSGTKVTARFPPEWTIPTEATRKVS
ncbi:MAG: PAS domain-containing sensor histidine kinase [Rhodospirillaceae bacterium]|nr:PAS domain-containing sensor histidine kinase [Rhodospirillaceae bacterium]MBT6204629.1 PAS domain-containing sensor histidine kinase [Rhodospirillaceae bacterium]MBT7611825.1 PAS domain-containing sensor histidine kinase [Rhodospirillaceae bacterium]MBT7647048.1 PAS domain-containing sensor histidine kinase [Rhodospirillaceae bacterium]